ncbi:MAG: RimJ/RimL family protein N-acetyltransferase [Sphingobacteriales bacterium]
MQPYIFTSARLGFRLWKPSDLPQLAAINADPEVMRFFPNLQSKVDSAEFMDRMNALFQKTGYCYWAVDTLEENQFIGFIGLSQPQFKADFLPNVDIGWRLGKSFWKQGYASEGAQRYLEFGKQHLGLKKIIAIAPKINKPSIRLMSKIRLHFRAHLFTQKWTKTPHFNRVF